MIDQFFAHPIISQLIFWLTHPITRKLFILGMIIIIALIVQRRASAIARRLAAASRLAIRHPNDRSKKIETLRRLLTSLIIVSTFGIVFLSGLVLFVPSSNIFWLIGLLAAGLGGGTHRIISDYVAGLSYFFEDPFDVGEKIEVRVPYEVIGVVEEVNIRNSYLRSPTGEIYIIPNGEIRTIRNFSRGVFSTADVILQIQSADLVPTLHLLNTLSTEAVNLLDDLLEPWEVFNEDGRIGQKIELKVVAKARYGRAAELRPQLFALLQERFTTAGIDLTQGSG